MSPPEKWTFHATCHECGVQIPVAVKGGEFRREGDDLAYVVTLDRMEVEAHTLIHEGAKT